MIDNFPTIKKSIEDLINDEEGNIPRGKLITIGSTLMLMGMIMGIDVYATHGSHKSHSSHSSTSYVRSHSSTSYVRSHSSHGSHTSHASHASSQTSDASTHASHSNTHSSAPAHVNSNTTPTHISNAGGSVPGTSEIPALQTPVPDNFGTNIPNISTAVSFELEVGKTIVPDFKLDNGK